MPDVGPEPQVEMLARTDILPCVVPVQLHCYHAACVTWLQWPVIGRSDHGAEDLAAMSIPVLRSHYQAACPGRQTSLQAALLWQVQRDQGLVLVALHRVAAKAGYLPSLVTWALSPLARERAQAGWRPARSYHDRLEPAAHAERR